VQAGDIAANAITTAKIAASAVTTAKIAANNVDSTLTKDALIADYTEVTIATGDSLLLGDVNDSGNTKRDTVQGLLDLAGGGATTVVGTAVASSSASLTITGLDSTYDTYMLVGADLVPATDNVDLWMRFGDSSGIDSASSDYGYRSAGTEAGFTADAINSAGSASAAQMLVNTDSASGPGNASGEGLGFTAMLTRPGDGTMRPTMAGQVTYWDPSTQLTSGEFFGGRNAVITLDRVLIQFASGNIATGRFTVIGIKHA
jgi:hypothetical protein